MGEQCMPCVVTSVGAFGGAAVYFWTLRHGKFGRIPALAISGSFATIALCRIRTFLKKEP